MGKVGEDIVCQMQVIEQDGEKEEDGTTVVYSSGKSGGCFNDKAIYFHRLSVPDLPQVPQSHGLDLGKQCVYVCICVCISVSAFIHSHNF